jgi:5-formyltetrahydrofolate cyclo-ligase
MMARLSGYPEGSQRVHPFVTPPPSERSGKAGLRRQLLSRRDHLSAGFRSRAAAALVQRAAAALDALPAGAVVGLYHAKGSELDVAALDARARRLGVRVAYPRVVPGQRALAFHQVTPAQLQVGRFGLREPSADAERVAPGDVAVFFVPGIAFDEYGGRLGWGKGYYDSTFAGAPQAMRFGVAFECQVVTRVPQTAHDIPLHLLFTEAKVRRFGA